MSLAVIKKTIKALSHQSQKAPDIFYIEGYFMGLGVHAQTVLPSAWLPDLFGSFGRALGDCLISPPAQNIPPE